MVVDNVDYTSGMEKNMSREFTDLTDTLCFGVSHQISIHLKICLAYLCFALVSPPPPKFASFKHQFSLPLKTGYVLNLIVFYSYPDILWRKRNIELDVMWNV